MCEVYISGRTQRGSHGNSRRFSRESIGKAAGFSMNIPEDWWKGPMRKTQLTWTESRAGLLGGLGRFQIPLCRSMQIVQECCGRSEEVQKSFTSTQGRGFCESTLVFPRSLQDSIINHGFQGSQEK